MMSVASARAYTEPQGLEQSELAPQYEPLPTFQLSASVVPMECIPTAATPVEQQLICSVPNEPPPVYHVAKFPVTTVKYQFSNLGPNSMTLLPPRDSPDPRPVYHISVSMNCFVPFSYITTVRRGGQEDGQFVGDFEMGAGNVSASMKPPTICLRGREISMKLSINVEPTGKAKNRWAWIPPRPNPTLQDLPVFCWNFSKKHGPFKCESRDGNQTLLATFIPPVRSQQRDGPAELPALEVTPAGHRLFDDILFSLLIIERQRNLCFPTWL
ncbi:hypothetical protein D9756_002712 [Leucocoprinus leucothites]|uniref:Uncharacterized protein n=1 Tax=Leucocoprinus leucothites TaxID=201217 RepID=A0A8H5GCW6_9AGAR|nr:hypothetical protein D9756_002712 [Leucoagaricus leucothites]